MNQVSQEPILKTRGLSKHFGGAQLSIKLIYKYVVAKCDVLLAQMVPVKVPFSNYSLASMYPVMEISTFFNQRINTLAPFQRIQMGMSIKFQIPGSFLN
jgi:branched-chain amino acid transport system ATP-binding protein